jgi:hypothetical protein
MPPSLLEILLTAAWRADQRAGQAELQRRDQEAAFFAGQAEGLRAAAYAADPTKLCADCAKICRSALGMADKTSGGRSDPTSMAHDSR